MACVQGIVVENVSADSLNIFKPSEVKLAQTYGPPISSRTFAMASGIKVPLSCNEKSVIMQVDVVFIVFTLAGCSIKKIMNMFKLGNKSFKT